MNRVEISRGEFTFDFAVKKIIELNDIYDPKFIYVDAGAGEYQIEVLRLHGKENPHTGLHKKVKRIQFSQNIEIRDPATNEVDKKDAKSFMVNQTSIVLERDQIIISPFDDMIWKQMMDYQVVRISQNGKPIYTSENEHALDGVMLTLLGFSLEFPEITKILEEIRLARKAIAVEGIVQRNLTNKAFGDIPDVFRSKHKKREREARDNPNWHWNKVPLGYSKKESSTWGRRGSSSPSLSRKGGFSRAKW